MPSSSSPDRRAQFYRVRLFLEGTASPTRFHRILATEPFANSTTVLLLEAYSRAPMPTVAGRQLEIKDNDRVFQRKTRTGESNASNQPFQKQVGPQLRKSRQQENCKRDAQKKARNFKVGPWRQGRKSQEPQAGNCHWPFGSPQERREGAEEKVVDDSRFGDR